MLVSVLCDICVLYCRLNTFRRVLDAEMKDLTADGVALKTKRAEKVGISAEEEKMFWDKGLLGCQTAETLVNMNFSRCVFHNCSINLVQK